MPVHRLTYSLNDKREAMQVNYERLVELDRKIRGGRWDKVQSIPTLEGSAFLYLSETVPGLAVVSQKRGDQPLSKIEIISNLSIASMRLLLKMHDLPYEETNISSKEKI